MREAGESLRERLFILLGYRYFDLNDFPSETKCEWPSLDSFCFIMADATCMRFETASKLLMLEDGVAALGPDFELIGVTGPFADGCTRNSSLLFFVDKVFGEGV